LWRRSLYTFWKRTALSPAMRIFDASAREFCTVRDTRTNTPLQSLNLMNDVTYIEAARMLAQRMLTEGGETPQERLAWAFRLATSRQAERKGVPDLLKNLTEQTDHFRRDQQEASRLLSVGEKRNEAEFAEKCLRVTLLLFFERIHMGLHRILYWLVGCDGLLHQCAILTARNLSDSEQTRSCGICPLVPLCPNFASFRFSPTDNALTPLLIASEMIRLLGQFFNKIWDSFSLGLSRCGQPERPREPLLRRLAAFGQHSLRQHSRRFDVGHIVHQVERLQRRMVRVSRTVQNSRAESVKDPHRRRQRRTFPEGIETTPPTILRLCRGRNR